MCRRQDPRASTASCAAPIPDTGEPFRLDRPDLLLWVHCCEVESFLTTARRAGRADQPDDADEYLREQVLAAEMVGIPAGMVPASVAEMTAVLP